MVLEVDFSYLAHFLELLSCVLERLYKKKIKVCPLFKGALSCYSVFCKMPKHIFKSGKTKNNVAVYFLKIVAAMRLNTVFRH